MKDTLRVYEVTDDWRYFVIAASSEEALTHAASQKGEACYDYLRRGPVVRLLDETETVPVWDFGRSEYEMLTPAEAIKRRIVHGVVYFEPAGDP